MSDEKVGPVKTATKPVRRPPAILCSTCARRALGAEAGVSTSESNSAPSSASPQLGFNGLLFERDFEKRLSVFKLKLRDWLNVERIETRPCLSVCPSTGITVERRGKTMVLDPSAIDAVDRLFDPTRQLTLFDES